jgi:predicted nuclease of restriction endonuclease-like (RecB) superfamily
MMKKNNNSIIQPPQGYSEWLADLKIKISTSQQKASLAINRELVLLYWQIGNEILTRQNQQGWGAKVIERLAYDLRTAFPEMRGFSRTNLLYMRQFAETWCDQQIVQQLVGQLPWGHNLVLLDKLQNNEDRIWYVKKTIQNNWSRNVLVMQIESKLIERQGKAINNFELCLPKQQSDLAIECLKDPYRFDFLSLGKEAKEREIENALIKQVTEFLLELGAGFAYVGKQFHLEVGGDDFFIDLLFYHLKLRCYIVIELKTGDFKPEHLGQLSFYLTAIDKQIKSKQDKPTIGLLLCKNKNKIIAEYALKDKTQPMGIAEFKLLESLPANLKNQLPSIEDIERELAGVENDE